MSLSKLVKNKRKESLQILRLCAYELENSNATESAQSKISELHDIFNKNEAITEVKK